MVSLFVRLVLLGVRDYDSPMWHDLLWIALLVFIVNKLEKKWPEFFS